MVLLVELAPMVARGSPRRDRLIAPPFPKHVHASKQLVGWKVTCTGTNPLDSRLLGSGYLSTDILVQYHFHAHGHEVKSNGITGKCDCFQRTGLHARRFRGYTHPLLDRMQSIRSNVAEESLLYM